MGVLPRFVVVRMPVAGRRDEAGARRPVLAPTVSDHPRLVEFRADHRVAAGLAVDHEIHRHRFMAMGVLHRVLRQEAEHRPHRVGDGPGGGEVPVGEQDADAIGVRGLGIGGDLRELLLRLAVLIEGRLEARDRRRRAEIAQQRRVMHPVEPRLAVRVMQGVAVRRQHHVVALRPVDGLAARVRPPAAAKHEEHLAGRLGRGHDRAADDTDEVGAERRGGRGTDDPQLFADVERLHARRSFVEERRREGAVRHRRDDALLDRVCRRTVVEILRVARQQVAIGQTLDTSHTNLLVWIT